MVATAIVKQQKVKQSYRKGAELVIVSLVFLVGQSCLKPLLATPIWVIKSDYGYCIFHRQVDYMILVVVEPSSPTVRFTKSFGVLIVIALGFRFWTWYDSVDWWTALATLVVGVIVKMIYQFKIKANPLSWNSLRHSHLLEFCTFISVYPLDVFTTCSYCTDTLVSALYFLIVKQFKLSDDFWLVNPIGK